MDNLSLFVKLGLDMQKFEKGLTQASQKMQAFGKSMTKTGKDLSMKVTAPVVGLGAVILNTAGNFEAAMNKVQAVSGATGSEFEALEKQARELGATTQFSASEAAEAMTFLSMAGFEANEILGAMPSTLNLAAAAQLDMGSAADIVSNIMAGFNMTSEELSGAVDVLAKQFTTSNTNLSQLGEAMKYVAPVASGLGVSIEETSAAIGILSDAGIQGSMAGTGLRRILSALSQESDKLGISVYNSDGTLRGFADIMQDLEATGISTTKIMEVFGDRGGPAMVALLSRGSDAIREQTKVLEAAGGTAEKISKTQMKGLNGALKALRSAFEELMLAIADSGFLDAVTSFAQRLTEVVRRLSETNPRLLNMAVVVAGVAAAIGPVLILVGQMSIGIGALSKALLFLAANPIILTVAGIAALGAAIYGIVQGFRQFNNEVDIAAEKQRALSNVRKQANKEVAGEVQRIKDLTKVAEDENKSKEDRLKAVKELQRISPKYNGVLEDEKINLEKLKTATDDVTDALVKQAMVKAARVEIEKLSAELLNLKSGAEQVGTSLGEDLFGIVKNAPGVMGIFSAASDIAVEAANNQRQAIAGVEAQMEALKKFIEQNQGMFDGLFTTGSGGGGGGEDPAKTQREKIELNKLEKQTIDQISTSTATLTKHQMQATPTIEGMTAKQNQLVDALQTTASTLAGPLQQGFQGFFNTLATGGQNAFKSIIDAIKRLIINLASAAATAAVLAGIIAVATGGSGKVFDLFKGGGKSLFGGIFGGMTGIQGFANGGVPPVGRPSIVGERGPELFVPHSKGTVVPNGMLGGGEVTFRIQGRELVGILGRESKMTNRL